MLRQMLGLSFESFDQAWTKFGSREHCSWEMGQKERENHDISAMLYDETYSSLSLTPGEESTLPAPGFDQKVPEKVMKKYMYCAYINKMSHANISAHTCRPFHLGNLMWKLWS